MPRGAVQIAGVHDQAEADLVVRCGANLIGFPFRLPVHREDLSEAEAAAIIRRLPPSCPGVLITYLDRADTILELCCELGVRHVQLHGDMPVEEMVRLRDREPELFIMKSLVVRPEILRQMERTARDFEPYVDAFITDTYDPGTGACGATGRTHDWSVSARLVSRLVRPVILAGGLHPKNVYEAILRVRPPGVDAHTGLEGYDGRKGEHLVRTFIEESRRGFAKVQAVGGP